MFSTNHSHFTLLLLKFRKLFVENNIIDLSMNLWILLLFYSRIFINFCNDTYLALTMSYTMTGVNKRLLLTIPF